MNAVTSLVVHVIDLANLGQSDLIHDTCLTRALSFWAQKNSMCSFLWTRNLVEFVKFERISCLICMEVLAIDQKFEI